MFWRPIYFINGALLAILGVMMLFPMIADALDNNRDWQVFAMSGLITSFVGMALFFTNRGYGGELKIRQAFLLTTTSWIMLSVFAALPFYLSEQNMSFVDAFFEAASGITTTGSSVMSGLDVAPPGLLLWRSMLNGLGGIGIVVMALAVLPMLKVGGMQLFRTESSDKSEKILPRTPQIALTITIIYIALALLCGWCYWLAGMTGFNALNHALATIATGGYSTHDKSIGHYDSVMIELIAVVFMIAGSLPLMLYYQVMNGNPKALWNNSQVRFFLYIIAGVTASLTGWLVFTEQMTPLPALRHSLFATVTVISTTGFGTQDFAAWGSFSTNLIFMLLVVGGCTGSTAGGIKIFRYQVFYETVKVQLRQLVQPHGVFIPRYENKPITETIIASVMTFFLLFAFSFMVIAVLISLYDIDFLTSMSAAAQALGNIGPGLGEIIGPAGNFSTMPDGVKWLLAGAMILGRLELFTVLVLFSPSFWRR